MKADSPSILWQIYLHHLPSATFLRYTTQPVLKQPKKNIQMKQGTKVILHHNHLDLVVHLLVLVVLHLRAARQNEEGLRRDPVPFLLVHLVVAAIRPYQHRKTVHHHQAFLHQDPVHLHHDLEVHRHRDLPRLLAQAHPQQEEHPLQDLVCRHHVLVHLPDQLEVYRLYRPDKMVSSWRVQLPR